METPSRRAAHHLLSVALALTACAPAAASAPPAPPGASGRVVARTHGLAIPAGHPRLWFDARRLEQARAWWRRNGVAPRRDDRIGQATRGLLGNDAGECRAAVEWAMAASAGMRRSGVSCDECRWSGEAIILAYDWCHAALSAAERAGFVSATNAWIDHWRRQPWGGPRMPENNYFWGYARNELLWAIASYEENAAFAEALLDGVFTARLENGFYPAADAGPMRGGVGREGTQYGVYIGAYATIPWVTAWLLGRDLFTESSYWREAAYHLVYSVSPRPTLGAGTGQRPSMGHTFFPYSDDEKWLHGRQIDASTGNFMTAIAMRWPDAPVGQHARQWLQATKAPRSAYVQAVDPGGAARGFSGLPLDFHGQGSGMVYARSGWTPAAAVVHVQLKDGPHEGHSHAHWGNWQIWRNGRYLSRETVSYGEKIAGHRGEGTVSADLHLGHNSLLVDGVGNRDAPWTSGRAVVRRLESRPAYLFAATDLTGTTRNAPFVSWEREYVFVRALETLVVLDRVESTAPGATKTVLVHCETRPVAEGGRATCTNGDQALVVTTLVPRAVEARVVAEGGKVGQHRIELDTSPGVARSHVLTVLQAKDAAAPPLSPQVTEDGSSYTLALDAATRITFAKGMRSSGGTYADASGTTALTEGIQEFVVAEDGPTWK